jgi:hypothetical protein
VAIKPEETKGGKGKKNWEDEKEEEKGRAKAEQRERPREKKTKRKKRERLVTKNRRKAGKTGEQTEEIPRNRRG